MQTPHGRSRLSWGRIQHWFLMLVNQVTVSRRVTPLMQANAMQPMLRHSPGVQTSTRQWLVVILCVLQCLHLYWSWQIQLTWQLLIGLSVPHAPLVRSTRSFDKAVEPSQYELYLDCVAWPCFHPSPAQETKVQQLKHARRFVFVTLPQAQNAHLDAQARVYADESGVQNEKHAYDAFVLLLHVVASLPPGRLLQSPRCFENLTVSACPSIFASLLLKQLGSNCMYLFTLI